ncbi:hypothetical protein A8W25_15910 [Streptomyces sp. ERV7]|nr:hypothetical protein A8W25_15910 [Streptomyces sp. ERV7]
MFFSSAYFIRITIFAFLVTYGRSCSAESSTAVWNSAGVFPSPPIVWHSPIPCEAVTGSLDSVQ